MPKSDRLFRLLTAFRMLPQPVSAARLARETGVSERTLYRDIQSLRAGGALIDGEAGFCQRLARRWHRPREHDGGVGPRERH